MRSLKIVDWLILIALSALLGFSGVDKLLHYEGFVNALRDYSLIPGSVTQLLAMPVILLEIFLAIALWIPQWRRAALYATGVLFLLFVAMIGGNVLFGQRNVCGCWFSLTLAANDELHIVQNLILSGLAFMVASELSPKKNPPAATASPSPGLEADV